MTHSEKLMRKWVITVPDGEVVYSAGEYYEIDYRRIVEAETPGKAKMKFLAAHGEQHLSDEFLLLRCRLATAEDLFTFPEVRP